MRTPEPVGMLPNWHDDLETMVDHPHDLVESLQKFATGQGGARARGKVGQPVKVIDERGIFEPCQVEFFKYGKWGQSARMRRSIVHVHLTATSGPTISRVARTHHRPSSMSSENAMGSSKGTYFTAPKPSSTAWRATLPKSSGMQARNARLMLA